MNIQTFLTPPQAVFFQSDILNGIFHFIIVKSAQLSVCERFILCHLLIAEKETGGIAHNFIQFRERKLYIS